MRKTLYTLALLALWLVQACNPAEDEEVVETINPLQPIIDSIKPLQGEPGTEISIEGRNYSDSISSNTVDFNGIPAIIKLASSRRLVVEVPQGATSGNITVTTNGLSASSQKEFIVLASNLIISGTQVETLAGSGEMGNTDNPITFNFPSNIISDGIDGYYIADSKNFRIRYIAKADNSIFNIFSLSQNQVPIGLAIDPGANLNSTIDDTLYATAIVNFGAQIAAGLGLVKIYYEAPSFIQRIVSIATSSGYNEGKSNVTGNRGIQINSPSGVAVNPKNRELYVTDTKNHLIRKLIQIDTRTYESFTIAGARDFVLVGNTNNVTIRPRAGYQDGINRDVLLNNPYGIVLDNTAENLYITDAGNNCIRKLNLATNQVTTVAGSPVAGSNDGNGIEARFRNPQGITIDKNGNLYVADVGNHRIRKITPSGEVTTLAGTTAGFVDGPGASAQLFAPTGVSVDNDGIYVADYINHRIRKITQ